jgi:hypothetical protein
MTAAHPPLPRLTGPCCSASRQQRGQRRWRTPAAVTRHTLVPCSRSAMAYLAASRDRVCRVIGASTSNRATRDGESWSGIRENRGNAQLSIDEIARQGRNRRGRSCGHHDADGRFTPMRPDHAVRLPTSQTRCADEPKRSPTMQTLPTRSTWTQPWGHRDARNHLNGVEPVQISRLVEWMHRGCC